MLDGSSGNLDFFGGTVWKPQKKMVKYVDGNKLEDSLGLVG